MNGWIFVALAVTANVVTNFSLKIAVRKVETGSVGTILLSLAKTPYVWIGLAGAAVLLVSFMVAIRTLPLSSAYSALTALAIASITFIEWWGQSEPMALAKIVGLVLAVGGVVLIAANTQ
ncbi:MAG: hypothetical protein AAF891_04825 [Pseudomonadota bacterium]